MKANFEFNLPEEQHEYEVFSRSLENQIKLEDISALIRQKIKYTEYLPKDIENILIEIHNLIGDID